MAGDNNVTRLLASRGVRFETYHLPEEKFSAEQTAQLLNVPVRKVYKTIVVRRPNGKLLLAVIPGDCRLDLKALAHFLGEKKVFLPTQREAEQRTGLLAGGISPLALMKRGFQVVIDASALEQDEIHISGGQRGLNIRLSASDLAELTRAQFAGVGTPSPLEEE